MLRSLDTEQPDQLWALAMPAVGPPGIPSGELAMPSVHGLFCAILYSLFTVSIRIVGRVWQDKLVDQFFLFPSIYEDQLCVHIV